MFETITGDGVQDRVRVPFFGGDPRPAEVPSFATTSPTSSHAGSRLDVLENAVRTLIGELSNERKIISGALHDLQRELMAQREETSRLGGITQDKIQALFGDRLQGIEQSLLAQPTPSSEIEGLNERVAMLERTYSARILPVCARRSTRCSPGPSRWPTFRP